MPRPLRIEYENAYYHVMNRGRSKQNIFHSRKYFGVFLSTLEEAHHRFGIQILCYCLMPNHYHLLIKTPEANLGRSMRHINGVYTQRHNRLRKIDGPLFRGRYKAIVVEEDNYLLQLSRYIHCNPFDAELIEKPEDYLWSSYRYYISKQKPPVWLFVQEVLGKLQTRKKLRDKYKTYVELGVDEEIQKFYSKGNIMSCLGSEEFREWVYRQHITDEDAVTEQEKFAFRPAMDEIIVRVAREFKVTPELILNSERGKINIPRWAAMYLCQETGNHRLIDIAKKFGLKRTGSIPTTIKKLKALLSLDKSLKNRINNVI